MTISWFCFWICVGAICVAVSAVMGAEAPPDRQRVREPAVAGLFYPESARELSREIERCLEQAKPHPVENLRALIVPHAGYTYSGPVAAYGYRLVQGRAFSTVVVLAPSHYALLDGASVCAADVFRTPLGDVPISPQAARLAEKPPFQREPRCRVQRPSWASQSSRSRPAAGEETAETWEHADEVQVPFLQKTLGKFALIPVVMGEVDAARAAGVLSEFVDDSTLIVVSSDLSHYHADAEARRLDTRCVEAICRLDVEAMESQEACGKVPIQTLLHIARAKGWKARLLDCRNSGEVTGDRGRGVVGYAAIAFHAPAAERLARAEQELLLQWARAAVRQATAQQTVTVPDKEKANGRLNEIRACFVTLTKGGELRGCIGHIQPIESLANAVVDNARSAALRDPRFPPVRPDEVEQLSIEISVLTLPRPLTFASPEELLSLLQPHRHGVVLEIENRRSTFLPQVWAQLPDKTRFLEQLSLKAGADRSAWRGKDVRVSVYEVESFAEGETRGSE